MTPGEEKFLDWAMAIMGAMLTFSGVRAINKQETKAEGRRYEGASAIRLGWLWLLLGMALLLGAIFNIRLLKWIGRAFFS